MSRIEHVGKTPTVHPSAWVAPNAVLCGDVRVGENSRILFGAILAAEGGSVTIGSDCIVMEGALIRGTRRHPTRIGDHVLVGPHAYLAGCTVAPEVFLATRATIFNGAVIESRAEVRIGGVVHVNSRVPEDATVPIGWVAVGDPAEILPPSDHDRIWAIQKELDFPGTVFGLNRPAAGESLMPDLTRRYAEALGRHRDDRVFEQRWEA
jgi:carbonic anhydrase/acetyltransferase-like protein (isoleucine patch superfamily)